MPFGWADAPNGNPSTHKVDRVDAPVTDAIAVAHVSAAVTAIGLGAWVFAVPKGTRLHRTLGGIYACLVVLLDIAALSLHRESSFGSFHVLAILSLTTITVALGLMIFTAKPQWVVVTHAFMMAWSYAGLLAAGMGQLAVKLDANSEVVVWSAILATLLISGIVIQIRVPRALGTVIG